jgi:hypothetical protein
MVAFELNFIAKFTKTLLLVSFRVLKVYVQGCQKYNEQRKSKVIHAIGAWRRLDGRIYGK